jgi:hypothetical protein
MKKAVLLAVSLTLSTVCYAQAIKPTPEAYRLYQPKNITPQRLSTLLSGLGVDSKYDASSGSLVVSGSEKMMAAADEIIKRLDVPQAAKPDVELTIYLLQASKEAGSDDIPAALNSVAKQLHALFPYKSYRIADTLVVRARDGSNSENDSSFVLAGKDPRRVSYNLRISDMGWREVSNGRSFRIERLMLGMNVVNDGSRGSIVTSVDLRENQKAVIGKSNLLGDDNAIILVLSAAAVQ